MMMMMIIIIIIALSSSKDSFLSQQRKSRNFQARDRCKGKPRLSRTSLASIHEKKNQEVLTEFLFN
jgi:hypothetical protein